MPNRTSPVPPSSMALQMREVARAALRKPPAEKVKSLLAAGLITKSEAERAISRLAKKNPRRSPSAARPKTRGS